MPTKDENLHDLIGEAREAKRLHDEEEAAHGSWVVGKDGRSAHARWMDAALRLAAAVIEADAADSPRPGNETVETGDYGPVLIRDLYEEEPDEIGYYDNEDSCDECGSELAVVLMRDGNERSVPWSLLKPCPQEVWKQAGFDPTRSLLGEDQSPDDGKVS